MGKLRNNQQGFTGIEGFLVIAVVVLIGVVGFMVYNNHKKATSVATVAATTPKPATTTAPAKAPAPTVPDPYAGWKSYTSSLQGLSFKYPANWVVTDVASQNSTYIGNTAYDPNSTSGPDPNVERVWITTDSTEASASTESATASGKPSCCYLGPSPLTVTESVVKAGTISMNTYQYQAPAPRLEAYWVSPGGKRYMATTSEDRYTQGGQDEVANLKLLLPTISFNN
jgi:hypothetical protein